MKSVQTVVGEILQEAQKIAAAVEGKDVMLRVHPEVAKVLKSQPEYVSAGARRDARPHRDGEERSAAPPGEVRFGVSPLVAAQSGSAGGLAAGVWCFEQRRRKSGAGCRYIMNRDTEKAPAAKTAGATAALRHAIID